MDKLTDILAFLLRPLNWGTARRWRDVLAYAALGTVAYTVLSPFVSFVAMCVQSAVFALRSSDGYPVGGALLPWAFFLAATLLVALGATALIHIGALRFGHFRTLLLFPPGWVSVLISIAALHRVGVLGSVPAVTWWVFVAVLLVGTALALGNQFLFDHVMKRRISATNGDAPTDADGGLVRMAGDTTALIAWLMKDDPIVHPRDDLFGRVVDAEDIARHLTDRYLKPVALIGPWGSGKTTVLNLAEHLLLRSTAFAAEHRRRWGEQHAGDWRAQRCPPRFLSFRLPTWGVASEPATSAFLRGAIDEVAKYADRLPLAGLPREYLAAASESAPGWLRVPLGLAANQSREAQLKRLDYVLAAINARLVVFIEDLDRNYSPPDVSIAQTFHTEGPGVTSTVDNAVAARPDSTVYAEFQAVLDNIAVMDEGRVSFVLALGRE